MRVNVCGARPAASRAGADARGGASEPTAARASRVRAASDLTRAEEQDLARRWRDQGDRRAADRIARAMLRHVASIALSYRNYNVPVADLVAEGNFGVVHALRKYDPDRGIRFVTYATYWVRAYILNHVISTWSLVGVGTGPLRSKMFFRLRREHARIEELAEAGAEGERQLAEDFGAPAGRVLAMARRLEARDVSLDVRTHDDGATRGEELADEGEDQEHRLGEAEERAALRARLAPVVGRLRPRERRIVEARLMADPEDVRSLADIGRELGVSRERARQLEARAKRRIREHLAADPRES